MAILLSISIGLLAGLWMTRVIKPLGLPAVTGYLFAGILAGPYCLGRLGEYLSVPGLGFSGDSINSLSLISDVALGFIAFSIGNEFRLTDLKKTGKQTVVVGIFQALTATLIVDLVLVAISQIPNSPLSVSGAITLGAIASATAPAATLMVVHQYKAHGPLTNLLLPVVALDDAVGLVIFAVSFGIARALNDGEVSLIAIAVNPLIEIFVSLVLGLLCGWLLHISEKFFNSGSKRLSLAVTFVLLTVALSKLKWTIGDIVIDFSPLLVCMMLGSVFCNLCPLSEDLMEKADRWTAPLYVIFFVLSGASLELSVLSSIPVVLIGLVYVLARAGGKYLGSNLSCGWTHTEPQVRKYLGITLFPQAGVALGMSLLAMQLSGTTGEIVRNITLFAVLIYELIGPFLTKVSLMKAGEITPKSGFIRHSEDSN